tara:strand:- start:138 stop:914 length:777 start_codon:yes stop_codon:yes gene_type:complete
MSQAKIQPPMQPPIQPPTQPGALTIAALILAGGQSQRFNYSDKGLIPFLNKPMIAHVIERIAPQVTSISISCNRNSAEYQSIYADYYRNMDVQPGLIATEATSTTLSLTTAPACFKDKSESPLQGPLAGIASFLDFGDSDTIFVCSCDMPMIPHNIVQQLLSAMSQSGADASYPVDEKGHHHLALLIKRSAAVNALQPLLAASEVENSPLEQKTKKHSIKNWLNQINTQKILVSSHSIGFADINSMTEMALIEQKTQR